MQFKPPVGFPLLSFETLSKTEILLHLNRKENHEDKVASARLICLQDGQDFKVCAQAKCCKKYKYIIICINITYSYQDAVCVTTEVLSTWISEL